MDPGKFTEWRNASSHATRTRLLREVMHMHEDADPELVDIYGKEFARDHKMNGMQEVFNKHCKEEDGETVKVVLCDLNAGMNEWRAKLMDMIERNIVTQLPRMDMWELEKNRDGETFHLTFKPYRFAHWSMFDNGRDTVVKDSNPFDFTKYANQDQRHYCWVLRAKSSKDLQPPGRYEVLIKKYINYSITKPKVINARFVSG